MKKKHLLLGFSMIMMLAFVPLNFYGQSDDAQPKTEKKTSSFDRHWFILGEAGLSMFHGDLNQFGFAPDPKHFKLNGNVGIGYQITPFFGAYGKIGGGKLGGEKEAIQNGMLRNAEIDENSFLDGNINLSLNLVNLIFGYNPDRMFTFAPHIGFGQINWKARSVDLLDGTLLHEIGYGTNDTEKGWMGDRASAWTFPFGADFNFRMSEKVDIYADYTFNFADSDNIDAFEDNGTTPRYWPEGTVRNDMYSHFNIGLRYKFISNSVKSMADNFGNVTLQAIPDPLEEKGDSVLVTIKGTFPPKYFKKNAVMNFTPVLTYDGGSVALKPMTFKGEAVTGDGTLINYAKGGSFTYTDKIPYHPNMNASELVVAPLIYPAKTITNTTRESIIENESYFQADQRKLADGVVYTSKRIDDNLKTSVAAHGYEKVTVASQNATIFYQVNLHNLNMNLPLNKKQENIDMLKAVTQNIAKGWELKDINIAGWASPEGEETFNDGLSDRRAGTAIKYIETELGKMLKDKKTTVSYTNVADVKFERSANGPDWNGFINAVEASNIKDKNAILNVVRSSNVTQREQEIRNMILIYPELENDILPPLRRAMITVNNFEPKKTDEEIAALSTSDPSKLQLNELLYAATLTEDLRTKKMIYASAMELHPTCFRAVANAAEVEIQLGNMAEAKRLLDKGVTMTDKSPIVYNSIAAVAVTERDFVKAEQNLIKAKQLGGDVDYNMGIVNIYKGDYPKAVSLMRSEKCDYNLGLAQLLNKEYDAAKATLECAPASAKADYLMAVIGARTNNNADVYSNLMKAIQKDENYKNTAKWDREFVKLFGEPDFQSIVK
ncbi:MAG: hypothetical protein CVT92_09630 [Bacteroidetes bacterium HGW-Bacteroidetes-1]|jgi:Flp pilus assembly protein TadD|nr:MAG: hypothetical protein CVT92_09630 [Bacteroidetes bacterium HGW-Bacteroidetes-1]